MRLVKCRRRRYSPDFVISGECLLGICLAPCDCCIALSGRSLGDGDVARDFRILCVGQGNISTLCEDTDFSF